MTTCRVGSRIYARSRTSTICFPGVGKQTRRSPLRQHQPISQCEQPAASSPVTPAVHVGCLQYAHSQPDLFATQPRESRSVKIIVGCQAAKRESDRSHGEVDSDRHSGRVRLQTPTLETAASSSSKTIVAHCSPEKKVLGGGAAVRIRTGNAFSSNPNRTIYESGRRARWIETRATPGA